MNPLRSLLLLALLLLAGCAQTETSPGSGLLARAPAPTFPPPPGPAAIVSLAELAAEPESYAGQYVQVTGQYHPPPVVVCDGEWRRSPAGWSITDGDVVVEAGGFDTVLAALLSRQAELTIRGRWLFWERPIGCGKAAPMRSIWYLAVQEIVEPQPLVRPTPAAAVAVATIPPDTRPPTSTPSPSPTSSPTSEAGATPTATLTLSPSPTIGTPAVTTTMTATATLTATITRGGTAAPTGTGTVEAATATATLEAGATPQATATEPSGTVVDRGTLAFQPLFGNPANFSPIALQIDELDANEIHRWVIDVRAGDVITASVAAQVERDLILELRDFAGNLILAQDQTGTGEVETIRRYSAPTSGAYYLSVYEATGANAYYTLLYLNSDYGQYYDYELVGVLPRNGSRTASMPAETDHLWLFVATGGSTVTITVAPSDGTDPILNLLSPERVLLFEYVNDRGPGQSEIILNARLEDSGMYVLHVGEDQYAASNYRVTVSGN
jgi:hypothetical protein